MFPTIHPSKLPILQSIRWRLVASYVLIALLTAGLIGLLALSLIGRYARQQAAGQLTANAQAIARQAVPLAQPAVRRAELSELAQSAAFSVNARVRILDDERRVLADSGPGSSSAQLLWIAPAARLRPELGESPWPSGPTTLILPPGKPFGTSGYAADEFAFLQKLPAGAEVTMMHRIEGPWGSRIVFRALPVTESSDGRRAVEADLREIAPEEETPRSQQVVVAPIGSDSHPWGFVEMSSSPDFSREMLAATGRALLLAAAGAIGLAVMAGLLVSRELTAPLRALAAAASRMSGGDLSARAPLRAKGEIGRLASQFNEMADRMETSFAELTAERDALRRFIADASHELRTPITALKTFNELLQGPAGDEAATRAEFLAESQLQLDRLERITHNLLDLSRLDAGLAALDLADCALEQLIQTAAAAFRNQAEANGIALSIQEPLPRLTLRCDRVRMDSALYNLLDNALNFTPAGGHVTVGAQQAGNALRLWVQDDGPGIGPDDLPRVFERFYRGQTAQGAGSGLGLSIVQSVVQAHGGRVSAESQLGRGSRFVIELPWPEE